MLGGFCEGNSSIAQAWVQQGFQPCFFFTLVPAVLLSVCLLLGALQYACYVRFGRAMEPKYIPRSRLYHGQVLLSLLLALQPVGGLLWQVGGPGRLYGYMLLHACLWALSWGCAVALLQLEHTRVLAHDRTRGHGTVLLLFWALAFAAENLTLVCWRSPLWWWALEDTNQKVGWGTAVREGGRGPVREGGCWGGVYMPRPAMPRVHVHYWVAPTHLRHVSAWRPAISHLSVPPSHSAPASAWPSPRHGGGRCPPAPHFYLFYPPALLRAVAPQVRGCRARCSREDENGLGAA